VLLLHCCIGAGVCLDGSSIVATCGNNGQYTIDGTW
jgi:hypothetical protein